MKMVRQSRGYLGPPLRRVGLRSVGPAGSPTRQARPTIALAVVVALLLVGWTLEAAVL